MVLPVVLEGSKHEKNVLINNSRHAWPTKLQLPFLNLPVVVGCTRVKKESCFKFLRVSAYLVQYDLLSILIPFSLKSPNKLVSAARKIKPDEEVFGGL